MSRGLNSSTSQFCCSSPTTGWAVLPERTFSQPELDQIAEFLNRNYKGWTLDAIRADLQQHIERERERYDGMHRDALVLCDPAVMGDEPSAQVYVEGAAEIVTATQFSSQQELHDLLTFHACRHRSGVRSPGRLRKAAKCRVWVSENSQKCCVSAAESACSPGAAPPTRRPHTESAGNSRVWAY